MSEQKLSIGRIVHFRAPGGVTHNGASVFPAMVTQIFDGSAYINLLVMPPFEPPYHEGSVSESDSAPRSWFWPPRV
jgi:hypothetical protein